MRLVHPDGSTVHLAYCSNVHQAEDLDGVVAALGRFAGPVRAALGVERLGVGLWLAAGAAAAARADPRHLDGLRRGLQRHGLEVVTLNGFPYGGFHQPVVKHAVYRPDWSEPARAAYTLDLARVLAGLLPDDVAGGTISTLPLGWRTMAEGDRRAARSALGRVADELAALAGRSGRRIRVGLEPEPGCAVETTAEAAAELGGLDGQWLGVCLDGCHLATAFEEPRAAVATLAAAGLPVVKAQVSSALHVPRPRSRQQVARLRAFDEPRFLHQVRERTPDGVAGTDDLAQALGGGLPGASAWRVHYHVPVHAGGDGTTQGVLRDLLAALAGGQHPVTHHLEVETYTWTVLPEQQRPATDAALVDGLARELAWTRDRLRELGCEQPAAAPHPGTTAAHLPAGEECP